MKVSEDVCAHYDALETLLRNIGSEAECEIGLGTWPVDTPFREMDFDNCELICDTDA